MNTEESILNKWDRALEDFIDYSNHIKNGHVFLPMALVNHAEAFGFYHSDDLVDELHQAEAAIERAVKAGVLREKDLLICPHCYFFLEEIYPEDISAFLKENRSYECYSCEHSFEPELDDIQLGYALKR